MKIKSFKTGFLLFFFLGVFQVVSAQETDFYRAPDIIYRKAMTLYRSGNYGAAGKWFDNYVARLPEKQNLKAENAAYYAAQCALKLHENDAMTRLSRFLSRYPESVWTPVVKFSMGVAYFDNRRYSQALKVFNQVPEEKLNRQQQLEYAYKKGYCLLKRNKMTEAMALFQKVMHSQSPFAAPAAYYYGYTQYELKNYDKALAAFTLIKNDPRFRKSVPLLLMQLYYQKGRYDSVLVLGRKYLPSAHYSEKTELNRLMANSLYEKGDFRGALPYFVAYEKSARSSIRPQEAYRLGYTYFYNQKYGEAVYQFQRATDAGGEVGQNAWYYLGRCYLKTAQFTAAQNAFFKAYQMNNINKTGIEALLAYARLTICLKGDRSRNAIALVQRFVNNSQVPASRRAEASALLAQLYVNTHNNLAALSSIEKSGVKEKSLQEAYQKLAFTQAVDFYDRRDFSRALAYFKKVSRYHTDADLYLQSLYWQASCYYNLGQYDRAVRTYKLFLSNSGAVRNSLYVPAEYDLAYAYFKLKNYPQAILWFKRFLNKHYNNPSMVNDARLRIADSYTLSENYSQAHLWYGKVMAAGGRNVDYALYEDAFCYGAQGRFDQKVKVLQQLVDRYPQSAYYTRALYDMASTYASSLNRSRQAIVYFQRIVKERPSSSYARMARVKMGLLYYKNNQYDLAIRQLKSVIAAFPASGEARVALSTLESIYKDKGDPAAYFAYARTLNFVQISKSQEDSLTFSVGEDAFLAGNCAKTEKALQNYLNRFPHGGFKVKSWHYLADCYLRQKDTARALSYFEKIIAWPVNDYTLPSLVKAARIEYLQKHYAKAAGFYRKVQRLAEDPSLKLEAVDGQMRANFLTGNLAAAAEAAATLIRMPEVSEDQTVYAHYVMAKAAWKAGNTATAAREFAITDKLAKGALGAESKYYLALMAFQNKKYDTAEKRVYVLSDGYPSEIYWVAKGFILLSDVYAAKGNVFQARETLKSIIANYPGNDLKQVARKKLAALPAEKSVVPANKNQKKKK
jgi:TolA-binding protein